VKSSRAVISLENRQVHILNVGLWDLYEPPGAIGHAVSNI